MNAPIQSYRQTVNKRTGRRGRRACLMRNECLVCNGTCDGYRDTEARMYQAREQYRMQKAELRARMLAKRK